MSDWWAAWDTGRAGARGDRSADARAGRPVGPGPRPGRAWVGRVPESAVDAKVERVLGLGARAAGAAATGDPPAPDAPAVSALLREAAAALVRARAQRGEPAPADRRLAAPRRGARAERGRGADARRRQRDGLPPVHGGAAGRAARRARRRSRGRARGRRPRGHAELGRRAGSCCACRTGRAPRSASSTVAVRSWAASGGWAARTRGTRDSATASTLRGWRPSRSARA